MSNSEGGLTVSESSKEDDYQDDNANVDQRPPGMAEGKCPDDAIDLTLSEDDSSVEIYITKPRKQGPRPSSTTTSTTDTQAGAQTGIHHRVARKRQRQHGTAAAYAFTNGNWNDLSNISDQERRDWNLAYSLQEEEIKAARGPAANGVVFPDPSDIMDAIKKTESDRDLVIDSMNELTKILEKFGAPSHCHGLHRKIIHLRGVPESTRKDMLQLNNWRNKVVHEAKYLRHADTSKERYMAVLSSVLLSLRLHASQLHYDQKWDRKQKKKQRIA